MLKRLKKLHKPEKVFAWLTITLIVTPLAIFAQNLLLGLSMDKNSYNCTSDSMMTQICHDPLGSAIAWTLLLVMFIGWPLLIAWMVSGIIVLIAQSKRTHFTDAVKIK